MTVRLVPDRSAPHGEAYDVNFRVPIGHGESKVIAYQKVRVNPPRHLSKSIDSPSAYDDAARAGVSFLLDDREGPFEDGDFEWSDRGVVIRRGKRLHAFAG
jgi:hypothetical protein